MTAAAKKTIILLTAVSLISAAACLQPANRASAETADLLQAARSRFDAGAFSSAAAALKSIVERYPRNARANYWLARSYYELHDYDSAAANAKRAVELDPGNSLYHQWLGRAYGRKAERDRSLFLARKVKREFERAVQSDPANIAARRDLLQFYIEAPWIVGGSMDKAREMVEAIARVDKIEGRLARADFYRTGLKRPDLAEREYRLVLDAGPMRIEPYLEIADFYEGMQNGPAMMEAILDAEKAGLADLRLDYYRGAALVIRGSGLETAENYLKNYLSAPERSDRPSHAAAHEWLGRLYELEDKAAEAFDQYRASIEMDGSRQAARAGLDRLKKALNK